MSKRNAFAVALILCFVGMLPSAAWSASSKKRPSQTPSAQEKRSKPPKGFLQMKVAGVMEASGGGHVVILKEDKEGYRLPIYIGNAEAFAIDLRLNRRRFQRPLTHDLLDRIMRELGGKIVKIHVDDLRDNTFMGTIFIRQKNRTITIDARPSDSIALAVGNRVPIFVSKKVLKRAGIREQDLKKKPGKSTDPEKLLEDILDSERDEHTL
jgi:bifunctional DNase/RNase